MLTFARAAGLLILGLMQTASGTALAAMVSLSGDVTYHERMALPPGAMLRVQLVDLTAAGMPARVDVQAPIGSPGQVPLTFALNFDDLALTAGHDHGLVAEIVAGSELWFRNNEPYRLDPLAPDEPLVIVTSFAGRVATAASTPPTPTEIPAAAEEIVGVTWRAVRIGGEPTSDGIDSTLSIDTDRRVGGRGGCNSYFAQVDIGASEIRLSAVAATRMACASPAATAQETAFFIALEAARYWRHDGEQLALLDADESEVLLLAAVTR